MWMVGNRCIWIFCCLILQTLVSSRQETTMKAARFTTKEAESAVIVKEAIPVPKEKEILIKVAFSAVNRADIMQRKGAYPPPEGASDIIGLEVSGTVHALGEGCVRWTVGDNVMALIPGGGYAEYVTAYEKHVMRVPDGLTLKEAGALPEVWLTAFQLLRLVASVKTGDRVLVHAAASGVGTAALQLLRHWGAVPMATVGSPAKMELCRRLGAQLVVNRKEDGEFQARVKEFSGGHGADIILDCVGGSYWERNAEALAVDGDWVLYGLLGGAEVSGPIFRHLLKKRGRMMGSALRSRSDEYKAELVAAFSAEILPYITRDGQLRPIIDSEFLLAEVDKAHLHVEANSNLGKVLLRIGGETTIQHHEL